MKTPSQQQTVQSLADIWEEFAPAHDETTVDQQAHYTEIHLPDGKPDVLQQIEHGVLQLAAQVNAIGYAIPGINESHLYQYRINDVREAYDFGYEEYFYSGDLCLVEWPEKIEQLLPDNVMTVRITVDSDTARTFEID